MTQGTLLRVSTSQGVELATHVLDFAKGHMGKNTILFLYGDQVPLGREVEFADRVRAAGGIAAHQVGVLRPPARGGDVAVTIVGSCRRTLTMCGGLSQVFGRFAAEGWFGERLPLEVREPLSTFTLETEAGLVPIEVSIKGGKVTQVTTRMNCFVDELYRDGVHPLNLLGVRAYRVGKVLVVNADEIQRMCQVADVAQLDEKARTALIDLQDRFLSDKRIGGEKSAEDFALYDLHPERGGDARIVFPHNLRAMYVEPSCGTGSVAAAIAVCEDAGLTDRTMEISFESGGLLTLGGPEITHVRLVTRQGRIREASFHHSVVERIAEGRVWISVGQ